jgi:hypothetical protein
MLLKPFVVNSHGRIVFPGNFFPIACHYVIIFDLCLR